MEAGGDWPVNKFADEAKGDGRRFLGDLAWIQEAVSVLYLEEWVSENLERI